MRWLVAIVFALLVSTSAYPEISLAVGADVKHDAGKQMAEIRYFGETWPHWSVYVGTQEVVGIELCTDIGKFNFGFGIEHASRSKIVDTGLAYQLRGEYRFNPNWGIGIRHRSNCSGTCNNDLFQWLMIGDKDSNNAGFNFLYLRRRF